MSIFDIILSLILLFGIYKGYRNGFIYEIAIVGALFLGLFAGFHFAHLIAPTVSKWFHANDQTIRIISFVVIFLLVLTGIFFLARLFTGLVSMTALGMFNKIAGAVFGFLKYAFLVSTFFMLVLSMDKKNSLISPQTKSESKLYKPVVDFAPSVLPNLNELKKNAQDVLEAKTDSIAK